MEGLLPRRMKRVRRFHAVLIVGMILVGAVTLSLCAAETQPKTPTRKDPLDTKKIVIILDQILSEEEQLLQATEEIKRELAIVKVRAATSKRVVLGSGQPCP